MFQKLFRTKRQQATTDYFPEEKLLIWLLILGVIND